MEIFQLVRRLLSTVCIEFADSQVTASGLSSSNPVINPGEAIEARAYSNISNVNWTSTGKVVVKRGMLPRYNRLMRIRTGFVWTRIDSIELSSAAAPLVLDESSSSFGGLEKIQVYRGTLSLTSTTTRLFFYFFELSTERHSTSVTNVQLTLRYRRDGANNLLQCYSADPLDDDDLICAEITGNLAQPLYFRDADFLMATAKSNNPALFANDVSQLNSVQFDVRSARAEVA